MKGLLTITIRKEGQCQKESQRKEILTLGRQSFQGKRARLNVSLENLTLQKELSYFDNSNPASGSHQIVFSKEEQRAKKISWSSWTKRVKRGNIWYPSRESNTCS